MLQARNLLGRKPTIRDVADAAGVSRAAVSLVLNNGEIRISDEKRQNIIKIAREMGYTPHAGARRLALRRLETLGLFLPSQLENLSEHDLFGITHAAAMAASERGYDLLLHFYELANKPSALMNIGRADGSIVVIGKRGGAELAEFCRQSGQPHVIIGGGPLTVKPENYVDVDIMSGTHAATTHLIELGHRHIGYIAHQAQTEKLNGYIIALTKAKIAIRKDWILETGYTENSMQATASAIAAMNPRPTSFVFTNDAMAIRMMKYLRDLGLHIPRDLSIIGFDNIETSALVSPALTTVGMPIHKLAQLAVSHLIALGEKRPVDSLHVMLSPELVIRESTGAPLNPSH